MIKTAVNKVAGYLIEWGQLKDVLAFFKDFFEKTILIIYLEEMAASK